MSNAAGTQNSIALNGQDFVLKPLNWKGLKERKEDIITINKLDPSRGMFSEEEQDAIARVLLTSLKRTRADITIEFVEEHVDLGNVGDMLKMVFGQEVAPKQGEANAAISPT